MTVERPAPERPAPDEMVSANRRTGDRGWRSVARLATAGWLVVITGVALLGVLRANEAVRRIEHERADSVRRQCVEQNARNVATVAKFDAEVTQLAATHPAEAQRAAESRAQTIALLDAIVPHKNCDQVVQDALHPPRRSVVVVPVVRVPTLPIPPIIARPHGFR